MKTHKIKKQVVAKSRKKGAQLNKEKKNRGYKKKKKKKLIH